MAGGKRSPCKAQNRPEFRSTATARGGSPAGSDRSKAICVLCRPACIVPPGPAPAVFRQQRRLFPAARGAPARRGRDGARMHGCTARADTSPQPCAAHPADLACRRTMRWPSLAIFRFPSGSGTDSRIGARRSPAAAPEPAGLLRMRNAAAAPRRGVSGAAPAAAVRARRRGFPALRRVRACAAARRAARRIPRASRGRACAGRRAARP